MNDVLARVLDSAIGTNNEGSRFNDHPLDWQRFYSFIETVHRTSKTERPDESTVREQIEKAMPHKSAWVEELAVVYTHGVDMLDYLATK